MPTSAGPNIKGEENLVFGYDLGDVINSYKNPPAINLVHRDIARGSTSGWDGYGVHTGYGLINHGTVEKDGRPDTIAVTWTDQGSGTQTGDWYPRFYLRNPDGSLVTTTGGEVFYATWEYKYEGEEYLTSGGVDYNTENFYGNGWKSGVHGSIDRLYIEELPLGWKRRVARIVAGDSGTVQTPMYRFGSGYKRANGGDFTLWLDNITITRDYPVHSWFPGQSEITSSEGLKDLIGNSTIDLSNVSFDSNAQMTFDGSNDYIALTGNILNVDSFTIEAVVNITSTGNYNKPIFVAGDLSSAGIWFFKHRSGLGNRLVMHGYDGVNPRIDVDSVNQVPDAENTYVAVTFNGNAYQLYMNGEPEDSPVVDNKVGATTTNYIGKQGGTYLNGDIPMMKIYTRALTASEIKSNFNAMKGRFNI